MRYVPAILIGRFVRTLARARKPGGGSAVPGLVVNTIAPGYLASALNSFPDGLIVVTGSSGKSTTTKMLVAILRAHGVSVFTNPSTANISQGLTSALLERADVRGRVPDQLAVLEMDEGHGAKMAPDLTPRIVVLTNVMTDQIDRFHDPGMVEAMVQAIAARATEGVTSNADDASLMRVMDTLGPDIEKVLYGVSASVLAENPRGLGYAETATTRLESNRGLVVTGVSGRTATLQGGDASLTVTLPARGIHYAVDAATALAAAGQILRDKFDPDLAAATVGTLPPVFGRGETVRVGDKTVEFVLVQNPASFQLNLDSLPPGLDQIMVAVGSDVRDPAYLWPVDTSALNRVAIVSGSQAMEIALQLRYQGVVIDRIEPDLATALDAFLALPPPLVGEKTIVFSADSMRRTRTHLGLNDDKEPSL